MRERMPARLRVLKAMLRHGHRYTWLRRATIAITLAVLFAVPSTGLARLDLATGRHWYLGQPSDAVFGAAGIVIAIVSFYVVTLLLNIALGRVFCGWGCPIGHASRLADLVDLASRTRSRRAAAWSAAIAWVLLLATSVWLWLCDPRVLLSGDVRTIAAAGGAVAASAVLLFAHAWWVRWSFCTKLCPIGVYYSAVQVPHAFGVHYDASACRDCEACTQVCPVGLHPRDLKRKRPSQGGISIDDFPEANHCLTCGDCVRACETVLERVRAPVGHDRVVALRLARHR